LTVGDAQGDTYSHFENLLGSFLADHLTGNPGPNVIDGNFGSDVMDGRLGADTLSYASMTAASLTVDLGTGTVGGGAQGDTFTGFENLTGGALSDNLTGDGGANVIAGGTGDDSLDGAGGTDTLKGGQGTDTCVNGESLLSCEL